MIGAHCACCGERKPAPCFYCGRAGSVTVCLDCRTKLDMKDLEIRRLRRQVDYLGKVARAGGRRRRP